MPQGTWRWLPAVVVVAVVFAGVLPRIANYEEVWDRLSAVSGATLAVVLASALWNIVTYWFMLMAALPGLTLRQAALSNQVSTAVSNVVPGGGAWGVGITWAMYRHWAFGREASARAMLLTAIWNNFVKLGLPLVALALVALSPGEDNAPMTVSLVAAMVLGASLASVVASIRSPRAARALGRIAGRAATRVQAALGREAVGDWETRAEQIRSDAAALLTQRWAALTVSAVVSHLSLYLVLLVCVRAVGIPGEVVSSVEVLVAFAIVRVALLVPATPGGAGLAELGLTGALAASGGPAPEVVASVLLYRALTWLIPIGLGAIAYLVWLHESGPLRLEARS